MENKIPNNKSQDPNKKNTNSKSQVSNKFQKLNGRVWCLEFGMYLELGT
jgi:succinyl-CoA synthetase beta subunit